MLDEIFLGNHVRDWLVAAGVFVATLGGLWLLKRLVTGRLGTLAERSSSEIDDLIAEMLRTTKPLFLAVVGVFAGSLTLELDPELAMGLRRAAMIAIILQGGIWATSAINFWIEGYRRRTLADDAAAVTTMTALSFAARVAVWTLATLLILDNLGIEVTALVTGLGIGGIAVALAIQSILGDLFASLAIVLDKPFAIGDYLVFGDFQGNVEHIGLKTTRLRSLSGEQLIVANSDLVGSRLRNFGRLRERRMTLGAGVPYHTPREKLERIPGMIEEAISRHDEARFDRAHMTGFGDYSIQFDSVYHVVVPEYGRALDIQEQVLLEMSRRFEEEGIDFAYPTRVVHVAGWENVPS